MKTNRFLKQFNWRFLLVRIVVNALALAVTAAITPKIYFVDKSIWNWLLMAIMLGVLNALLKPILQILTLQFLFVTFGLVLVLVNALILMMLSFLFPNRFAVDSLLWALVGGLVLGLVSSFLESLLGLTTPIVPDEPPELRQQVEEQARHVDWLGAAKHESELEEQAQAIETQAADAKAPGSSATDLAAPEPPAPEPDEGPSPPAEVEVGPLDSAEIPPAELVNSDEANASESPEPTPEPREEQKEDGS